MAPSNLQGLNIVHPPQPQNPYLSDQDLLAVPPFPDLSAQLDLWTNLNFQSDEPLVSREDRRDSFDEKGKGSFSSGEKDADRYNMPEEELQDIGKIAEAHAHENVVTGTVLPPNNNNSGNQPLLNLQGLPLQPPLDIGTLLAGFGIDPFQLPPVPQQPSQVSPSLAQLLSLHASSLRPSQTSNVQQSTHLESTNPTPANPSAPKRARTARLSVSVSEQGSPESPLSPESDDKSNSTPLNAAEDKRRRNTAASARFRLKKKEREAALEKKAKELEVRVSELEKECEALRRENGWLKGLVVGVTGAGAVQQQQHAAVTAPGTKRSRDESDPDPTA
ncbi:unnamed protein product [Somion occarium]|uniref:BZIP domain-containing protein n=1 Tax=Somion occarium TaxID=3059160 RepID=A0ABP1DGR9_9APHY